MPFIQLTSYLFFRYIRPVRIDEVMRSADVCQVIKSSNADFKVGELVRTHCGWQEYAVMKPSDDVVKIKAFPGVSPSTYLGVLGLTGLTAYFGLFEVGEIVKKGGPNCTVVVSGVRMLTDKPTLQTLNCKKCPLICQLNDRLLEQQDPLQHRLPSMSLDAA